MKYRISVIGGGTGISSILRGLSRNYKDINAIVNVVDNGGSSGILRKQLGIIPPGDLRSCVLAMSNTTPIIEKLFSYRFKKGIVDGHSLGNLIITALSEITGSMENALGEAASIFNINGRVFAVTTENIDLIATLKDGTKIIGESQIPLESIKRNSEIDLVNLYPSRPKAYKEVLDVLGTSNLIIIGPGSLYTSILPALLVSGVREAILRSNAKLVYIQNLMTQPGETTNYNIKDHINVIYKHCEDIEFDYVFANDYILEDKILKRYNDVGSIQILINKEDILFLEENNIKLVQGKFIDIKDNKIRHDDKNVLKELKKLEKIK